MSPSLHSSTLPEEPPRYHETLRPVPQHPNARDYIYSSYPSLPSMQDTHEASENYSFLSFATASLSEEQPSCSLGISMNQPTHGQYAHPGCEPNYGTTHPSELHLPPLSDGRPSHPHSGCLYPHYRPAHDIPAGSHQVEVFHDVDRNTLVHRPRLNPRTSSMATRLPAPYANYTHKHPHGLPYYPMLEGIRYNEYRSVPHRIAPGPQMYPATMDAHFNCTIQPMPPAPDRPYICGQCNASFNRNHDLKRHTRIHLEVKPFPCGWCEKAFSRKDALKRHLMVKACAGTKDVTVEESVRRAEQLRKAKTQPPSSAEIHGSYSNHSTSSGQSNGSEDSDQSPSAEATFQTANSELFLFRNSVCSTSDDSVSTNGSVTCSA